MQLESEDRLVSKKPDDDTVRQTLQRLAVVEESYAILSVDDMTYLQAARERGNEGYVLEYQQGSTKRHYRCTDGYLDLDDVVRAFLLYLHGDEAWRTEYSWERMDFRWYSRGSYFQLTLVLILLVVLLVWLFVR